MSQPTMNITYIPPGSIDLDPAEVGGVAIEQQVDILIAARGVLDETIIQARSSYLSRLLDAEPTAGGEQMSEAWEEAPVNAALTRARGALDTAISLCESAQEGL